MVKVIQIIRTRVLSLVPEGLKVGGHFLLEAYTPTQLEYKTGGPPVVDLMYSAEILAKAFPEDGNMDTLRNVELTRSVVEGKYHTGKAAVVQYLGCRKMTTTN